jgi:hypothetical protein
MPKKSTPSAPKAPAAAPNNKSAMTNDPLKLEEVDGRSKVGRRLRDLTASLTALVAVDGEPLDDVVAGWIKLAAAGTLRGEQIAAAIGRGEVVKDEDLVRIQNAANRTMRELRDLKASRTAAKPFDMADYLAAHPFEAPAAEPEDDDAEDGGRPRRGSTSPSPRLSRAFKRPPSPRPRQSRSRSSRSSRRPSRAARSRSCSTRARGRQLIRSDRPCRKSSAPCSPMVIRRPRTSSS